MQNIIMQRVHITIVYTEKQQVLDILSVWLLCSMCHIILSLPVWFYIFHIST